MAKLSFHCGAPIKTLLDGWEDNRSGRLNGIAERYRTLMETESRQFSFTLGEWNAIIAALEGAEIEGRDVRDWRQAWAFVFASGKKPGFSADHPGIDCHPLGLRLQGMSEAARCALWETAAAYWAGHEDQTALFLEAHGIVVAEQVDDKVP